MDRTARHWQQLHELEDRLAILPPFSDRLTAAESVEHCALQVSYWRTAQAIASMQFTNPELDNDKRGAAYKWLTMATTEAGEWEKRKSVAQKNLIDDRLADLQDKLKFLLDAGDALEEEGLVT